MTTFRISTPVPKFNGEVGGCQFANGTYEGEVGDGPLAYFRAQGYGVEELDETPAEPKDVEPPASEPTFADDPKVAPAGNASADDWRVHVLAIGATDDQIKGLGRDQLRELAAKLAEKKEPKA